MPQLLTCARKPSLWESARSRIFFSCLAILTCRPLQGTEMAAGQASQQQPQLGLPDDLISQAGATMLSGMGRSVNPVTVSQQGLLSCRGTMKAASQTQ